MVGLGFSCALRGLERHVWSVTLYFFLVSVFLLFYFLSFFFVLLDVLRC